MTEFVKAIIDGLALGAIYALLALGFVIIYKATQVISFAQPALMVLGAWWTIYFGTILGWNFWLALAVAVVLSGVVAAVIERIAMRPMVGEPPFAAVMVTIGIDIIVRTIAHDLIGTGGARPVGDPWGADTLELGGVVIATKSVAVLVVTIVVVGALLLFYKRTRYGLAMQATAFDQETALAQGIPVGRMFGLSWAIAGALAAVAGTFVGAGLTGVSQETWVVALKALPVIILGGLDSIPGALIGGLIIGLTEVLVSVYQPRLAPWLGSNFATVAPYAVMLLVLLVRPYGLYGTPEVERV